MVIGGGVNAIVRAATATSATAHQPPRIVPSTFFVRLGAIPDGSNSAGRLFLRAV
jgi:hypothetical protein